MKMGQLIEVNFDPDIQRKLMDMGIWEEVLSRKAHIAITKGGVLLFYDNMSSILNLTTMEQF